MTTSSTPEPQPDRRAAFDEMQRHRRTLRTLRLVMPLLGFAVGIVLLASGYIVVGALIGGLAAVRLAVLLMVEQKRRAWMSQATLDRGPADWPPPSLWPPPSPTAAGSTGGLNAEGPHRLARREFAIAAATIGVDAADLGRDFADGRSIADVATAKGVAPRSVVDAIVTDAAAVIDRARSNGRLSPSTTGPNRDRLTDWATRLVNRRGPAGSPLAS